MIIFTKQTVWVNAAKPEPPNTMLIIFSWLTMIHRKLIPYSPQQECNGNTKRRHTIQCQVHYLSYATKCSTFQGYELVSLVIEA